jgi:hypothetical protein
MISSNTGNYIQQMMNLLEWIKMEMGEIAGISKQREGQVSNRETVGGVERATLQSSYITEWLFATHDDTKKRVLEVFLEATKISMRGRKMKFQYVTSDISQRIMEINGDDFAMNDYGLVVDSGNNVTDLLQKLEGAAQAAAQTGSVDISALMKIWSSASLAQKIRIVERNEQKKQEQMMQDQLEISRQQFVPMAIILLLTVPIFFWILLRLPAVGAAADIATGIVMPFAGIVSLSATVLWFIPAWIIWYMLCSLAMSQVIRKSLNIGGI